MERYVDSEFLLRKSYLELRVSFVTGNRSVIGREQDVPVNILEALDFIEQVTKRPGTFDPQHTDRELLRNYYVLMLTIWEIIEITPTIDITQLLVRAGIVINKTVIQIPMCWEQDNKHGREADPEDYEEILHFLGYNGYRSYIEDFITCMSIDNMNSSLHQYG